MITGSGGRTVKNFFYRNRAALLLRISRDITLQKLNDFSASLEQTRAELAATEQKIAELQKQAGTTPDRLTTQMRETDDGAVLQQLKGLFADAGVETYRTPDQIFISLAIGWFRKSTRRLPILGLPSRPKRASR